MKVTFSKIRSFIFILLFVTGMTLIVPLHNKLTSSANSVVNLLSDELREKTGLSFNYESLSPSILSTFYVKNIILYDEDLNVVLSIDKTKVNYNLFKILKKDFKNGITSIVIDGINLKIAEVLETLKKNSEKLPAVVENIETADFENKKLSQKDGKAKKNIDLNAVFKLIPQNVKLKNISLDYNSSAVSAELLLREISVSSPEDSQALNFQINSRIKTVIRSLKQTFSGNVVFTGSIFPELENSFVNVKLSDFTNGRVTVNRLNFLVSYFENLIDLHIIQAANPIAFGIDYHLDTKDMNIQLKTEDFSPASVIDSRTKRKLIKKIRDLEVTTDTIVKCNFAGKSINYISDLSVKIPDSIFAGGMNVKTSLYGDEKTLTVSDFSADGENCNADMSFNLIYDKFRLSGFAELPFLRLANGTVISTELYMDAQDEGFMLFSPQLFLGEKSLTALQLSVVPKADSFSYFLDVSDYSHAFDTDGEPGTLKLDGTVFPKSRYFEINVGLQRLFADSLVELAGQFLSEAKRESLETAKTSLSAVMFTGDVYLSTDLKSFSYNVPYIVTANTKKDDQFLMLSFGGNESSLQLNNLSFVSGKFAFEAAATVEKNIGEKDMFFDVDIKYASIPYHFTGNIIDDFVSISGDYNTEFFLHFNKNNLLSGSVAFENLPLTVGNTSGLISSDVNFNYSKTDGPEIFISKFEVEGAGLSHSVSPKIYFSGNISKYGASFDTVSYSDFYSSLVGKAAVGFDYSNSILNSVTANLYVSNSVAEESVLLELTASNPEQKSLSVDSILNSLYLNMQLQVTNLNLNRIASAKNDSNLLSASVLATGTVMHPYVSITLGNLSLYSAGSMLNANGQAVLEDRLFSIQYMNFIRNKMEISDITAEFSVEDFSGSAKGQLHTAVTGKQIDVPLKIEINNATKAEGKLLPDSYLLNISSELISGAFVKKPFKFSVSAFVDKDSYNFFSSENIGFYGTVSKAGDIAVRLDNKDFAKFAVNGSVKNSVLNVDVTDVNVNMKKAMSYFDLDRLFIANNGILTGFVKLRGLASDPDITGDLKLTEPEITYSIISSLKVHAPEAFITIGNSEIKIQETLFYSKNTPKISASCTIMLNKWSVDRIEVPIKSYGNEMVPGLLHTRRFDVKSKINVDLLLVYEDALLEITGKINGENSDFITDISKITSEGVERGLQFRFDIDLNMGTHGTFNVEPLIRCVFVPNTRLGIKVDTLSDTYIVEGSMKMRSGDISYLNRSFYIKSGQFKFTTGDFTNPIVSISAETRERDEKGQNITIMMNVENQYLQELNPKFSSKPSLSDAKIRQLLGQIAVADSASASSFLFAAGDYAIQSSIGRKIENSLRDLLNFDIFSVRTNVLQNTLNYQVSRSRSSADKETFTIGNLLDNSTVYIGKYLNSSLYVDAMLQLSFDETVTQYDELNMGNLIFQPEFGMELESPFANIRWNVAPDIKAIMEGQYKPSSSITLSWKFAF